MSVSSVSVEAGRIMVLKHSAMTCLFDKTGALPGDVLSRLEKMANEMKCKRDMRVPFVTPTVDGKLVVIGGESRYYAQRLLCTDSIRVFVDNSHELFGVNSDADFLQAPCW